MSIPAQQFAYTAPTFIEKHKLQVSLAGSHRDIVAAQRLRYQVFVEELGARIDALMPGVESDRFDRYCQHLIVRDCEADRVVGSYRLLTDAQAVRAGGYYAETEFDLTRILATPGRFMEVGRSCVHPDYRTGAVIALLWAGLARFITANKIDYIMGCASVPMNLGIRQVTGLYRRLLDRHLSPAEWRVFPKVPMPRLDIEGESMDTAVPPLLKAYLRLGAMLCGEPAWDPHFNVADLFVLLPVMRMQGRYKRHFMRA